MEPKMAYCATCDRPVRVVLVRDMEPDEPVGRDDVVCLEHGQVCGVGTVCPIFDVPSEKMKENLDAHRREAEEK